jgi:hypothetical protein
VYEQFARHAVKVEILPGRAGIRSTIPVKSLQDYGVVRGVGAWRIDGGSAACIRWQALHWGNEMAKKSKLTQVAVKIGTAVGKADRTAHRVARAGGIAKAELEDISKQVDALKRQLQKTTKRLKAALR